MKMELKKIGEDKFYVEFTREKDGATRGVNVSKEELLSFRKQLIEIFDEMTFDRYQELRRRTDKYTDKEAPFCHALGLGSEAGEYQGKVDKLYRKTHKFEPTDEQREALAFESSDCLWYLSGCADDIGYRLEDIAKMNIKKLADRDKRGVIATFEGGDYR